MQDGERLRLLITLVNSGQHQIATELTGIGPAFSGPLAANRQDFVEGLILRAEGDLAGSVEKFRSVLADNPSLTLVRKELAVTLNAMGEDDSAKHHLELLMAEAPDQQAAGSIKSFIDQIDAKQPWKFSAFLSLAPTTNVNGGTKHDVIYSASGLAFTPDVVEESGIGLAAGVNGGYSTSLGNQNSLVLGAGFNGRLYEDGSFNQLTISETAELRHSFLRGYAGIGAIGSQSISGQHLDLSYYSYGPRLTALYRPTPKSSLQSTSTIEFKTYPGSEIYDGYTVGEILNGTYAFNQATVAFGTLGYEFTKTTVDRLDTDAFILGAGLYRELPFGVSVTGNGRVRFTDYLDDWGLIGAPREDVRYDATVSLTKRDWSFWGYAPEIEYAYARNDSNIDIYETESHSVDLRLTKDF